VGNEHAGDAWNWLESDLAEWIETELADLDEAELEREFAASLAEARLARPAQRRRRGTVRRQRLTSRRPVRPTCSVCGRPFAATRSDARYCGTPCRMRAYRTRRSATHGEVRD
jgi:hypothetical protein